MWNDHKSRANGRPQLEVVLIFQKTVLSSSLVTIFIDYKNTVDWHRNRLDLSYPNDSYRSVSNEEMSEDVAQKSYRSQWNDAIGHFFLSADEKRFFTCSED